MGLSEFTTEEPRTPHPANDSHASDSSESTGVTTRHRWWLAGASAVVLALTAAGAITLTRQNNTNVVSTLAGTGQEGSRDGAADQASFEVPSGVAVDDAGNVYVADLSNNKIRVIGTDGIVSTLAGTGVRGDRDGAADQALLANPSGVAVDDAGNVYIADLVSRKIRVIRRQ